MKKTILIFSGFNNRAVLSFCRVLAKNEVSFAIVASDNTDPIFLTDYASNVVCTRKKRQLDFADICHSIELCQKKFGENQEFVYAPSTEALNRFLLKYFTTMQQRFKIHIPLVSEGLYIQISDKKAFGKLCSDNGFRIPNEYSSKEISAFPVVAKPKEYISSIGISYVPVIINNVEEWELFLTNHVASDFYFQEFVGGESHYLLYYVSTNGEIKKYAQQNLVQQSAGKSVLAAIPSKLYQTEISENYESFLLKIGFTGFVMIELKYFNDKYYMIEANPRFWGPSQLLIDCKTNLFEAFLRDYGFDVAITHETHDNCKYFWYGGMVQELKKTNKLAFHAYSEELLYSNLSEWLRHDIYNKPDSVRAFLKETIDA